MHCPQALANCCVLALLLITEAPAQDDQAPPRFAELQSRFAAERDALLRDKQGRVEYPDIKALAQRHASELAAWLEQGPPAVDAVNGRLMLTNIWMDIGERDRATEVLAGLDVADAPALALATGAEMAQALGMDELRSRWIAAAIDKEAPFDERMALAMYLSTRLVEVEAGEAVFASEAAAAEDEEGRARVAYYRCEAIREREDLPDGSYEQALAELAERYPGTYHGSVAGDRLQALAMDVGSPAIPFDAPTLDGGRLTLAELQGKVVLLDFWNLASVRNPTIPATLGKLLTDHGERGLVVVGVNLDEDAEAVRHAVRQSALDWPHLFDGRGWRSDVALRYAIENTPSQLLIDREGRMAAVRIYLFDEYGVSDLREAIDTALGD